MDVRLPLDLAKRWVVERPLGSGGSATTYRGRRVADDQLVALKILRFESLPDWKTLELFEREATALATLRVRGVPKLFAHEKSKDGKTLLLAQELIEGPTLAERIAAERLTEPKARTLCVSLLQVIHELSVARPPIVHRDVKPSNVIVGSDRVYLVDFGGVRVGGGGESRSTMVGTFGYMAPEQLWGGATTVSDLYGLGMTALFAITGVEPDQYEREGLAVVIPKSLKVTPGFRRWLRKMVEADPSQRYPSAAEALRVLKGLSGKQVRTRVDGLLGAPPVPLSPALDRYHDGRSRWVLPLPPSERTFLGSRTVAVEIGDETLTVGSGRKSESVRWEEIEAGRVWFGREAECELHVRLETATTPLEFNCVTSPTGSAALIGAIWPRIPHMPGLAARNETMRRSRALGVSVPVDVWELGDEAIRRRGGRFDLRCELRRERGAATWRLKAAVRVPVHVHVFLASSGRSASPDRVTDAFLKEPAARAAWLALTRSPPDALLWSDVQVCGENLTWSARAESQPHAVEIFELALSVLAWRMMSLGAR